MISLLLTLAVALAAFCIWLGVRLVNRRERWAKRTAVAMVVVLAGYPLSFGPIAWLSATPDSADGSIEKATAAMTMYWPIGRYFGPTSSSLTSDLLSCWLLLGVPKEHCIYLTDNPQGRVSMTYCKP